MFSMQRSWSRLTMLVHAVNWMVLAVTRFAYLFNVICMVICVNWLLDSTHRSVKILIVPNASCYVHWFFFIVLIANKIVAKSPCVVYMILFFLSSTEISWGLGGVCPKTHQYSHSQFRILCDRSCWSKIKYQIRSKFHTKNWSLEE